MTRFWSLAAVALLGSCLPLMAADNTSKVLADTAAKAPMLAFLTYTIDNDPPQVVPAGQALCINAADGIFMTYGVEGWMKTKNLKDATLRLSDEKTVKATLMWVDPETGLGFFRAEKGNYLAANFQKDPKFTVGQQLSSLGLLEEPNHTPYVTSAYVSAVLKSNETLVYVTNGHLTCEGSPVLNENGEVVGIVTPQPFDRFLTPTQQGGQQEFLLKGQQTTSYFSPISKFATILDYMAKTPDTPRVMPWIGAQGFDVLPPTDSRFEQFKTPVLRLGMVIPGQNGEKAGLLTDDLIVALNGKTFEKLPDARVIARNFQRELLQLGVGTDITLTVRHPKLKEDAQVKLHLEAVPPQPQAAPRYASPTMGFIARELVMLDQYNDATPAAKNNAKGVLVIYCPEHTPAYVGGLAVNDLIVMANEQKVESVADLKKAIEDSAKASPEKEVKLVIRRGNEAETQSITVKPVVRPTTAPAK